VAAEKRAKDLEARLEACTQAQRGAASAHGNNPPAAAEAPKLKRQVNNSHNAHCSRDARS
jgi:hypothetical protein